MSDKEVVAMRQCRKCGAVKLVSEFRKGKRSCRSCIAEQKRLYRLAHRTEIAEYNHLYELAHRDRKAERNQLYRQVNRGKMVEHQRRRRAMQKQALPSDVTASIVERHLTSQMKRQKRRCYYCGRKFVIGHSRLKPTVDHIVPLNRGGEHRPENLVWAHASCNSSKHNKLPHEWPRGERLL